MKKEQWRKSFPAPRAPKQRNGSASSSGFHWLWLLLCWFWWRWWHDDGDDDGDLLSMMNNQDGRAPALGPGGDFKKVSKLRKGKLNYWREYMIGNGKPWKRKETMIRESDTMKEKTESINMVWLSKNNSATNILISRVRASPPERSNLLHW